MLVYHIASFIALTVLKVSLFADVSELCRGLRIDIQYQRGPESEGLWSAELEQKQNNIASISCGSGIIENK